MAVIFNCVELKVASIIKKVIVHGHCEQITSVFTAVHMCYHNDSFPLYTYFIHYEYKEGTSSISLFSYMTGKNPEYNPLYICFYELPRGRASHETVQ